MSDVKWIKIVTDIFDDEKILLIESLPEADSIIVIWFKLLTLAGKQNNSGVFMLNDRMPYTDEMFATIFRRKKATVQMALRTFEEFGMIEVINDAVTIPNWSKHQTLDQIQSRNEYMKTYMRKYREKQKELANGDCKLNSKLNSKLNVSETELELEVDKNKNKNKNKNVEGTQFDYVINEWNNLDKNISNIQNINSGTTRYKLLKARENEYGKEKILEAIRNINNSNFLKGYEKSWKITFDWFIKPNNFIKVLEGNYNDSKPNNPNNLYLDDKRMSKDERQIFIEKKLQQKIPINKNRR